MEFLFEIFLPAISMVYDVNLKNTILEDKNSSKIVESEQLAKEEPTKNSSKDTRNSGIELPRRTRNTSSRFND